MAETEQDQLKERVIEPVNIDVEDRSGYHVLVVEDSGSNKYTTLDDDLVEEVPSDKDRYIGSSWKILWSETEEGFTNFHGFQEKVDKEPERKEIETEQGKSLAERDIKITRQSATHDASRIVMGKLGSGERMSDAEIKEELEKWADYFKNYFRTGDWNS